MQRGHVSQFGPEPLEPQQHGERLVVAEPGPPRSQRHHERAGRPRQDSSTTPQNWPFCASRLTADLPPRRGSLRDRTDTLEPARDATQNALPLPAAADEVLRERARDAPCHQRVRRVHQLEMQVRGGRVAGMADPPDHLPGADLLPPAHRDAAGDARCAYRAYVRPAPMIT